MCICRKCAKLYMKKMWRDTHESGYLVYFGGWGSEWLRKLIFYKLCIV